jgi:hypothetical protein
MDKGGKDGLALCIITNTTKTIFLSGQGFQSQQVSDITLLLLFQFQMIFQNKAGKLLPTGEISKQ